MAEYIDRTEIFKGCSFIIPEKADAALTVQKLLERINSMPAADVVSIGVLAQVQWERDVAIDQLNSYGVGFAEKADVVRVVRCKDCKHYKKVTQSVRWNIKPLYCCRSATVKTKPDDFCSYGERRSDNDRA